MIRVCLISLYAYRLFRPKDGRASPFGGSEVQQYQFGVELSKDRNFEVSFIVGDFYREQQKSERVRIENVDIDLYKAVKCGKRFSLIDSILDFWKLFLAMKKTSADVYIIRGGGSLAGKVAILAKKILKKKFIYSSAHDRDSNRDFFKHHGKIINWLFEYALRHADVVICQHNGQKEAFSENLGIKAMVIRSMYSIEDESRIPNYESREYVLWVSRLENWKQPEIFAVLAKRFLDEKFLLITNSDTSKFKRAIGKITNFAMVNNVPFQKIDDYFKKAKVFVSTSSSEGFPNTFVQAAKNKTPILSLRVNPEGMLEKYGIGRCAKGSVSQLENDMREILSNETMWSTMSRNAYSYAKGNHDIKKIADEYKILFREVATS